MPLVRTRCKGDRDIVIQKKIPFMPRSWSSSWKDWATLSSEPRHIEVEISKLMAKVQDLVFQYIEAEKMLAGERKIVEANEWGYGPPRQMSTKEFDKLKRNVPEPALEWKRMLSTHFLKRNGLGRPAAPRGQSGSNQKEVSEGVGNARQDMSQEGGAHTTVYTLPGSGAEAKGFDPSDVGADSHLEFREPNQKQNNNQQQRKKQNNRNQGSRNNNQDNG